LGVKTYIARRLLEIVPIILAAVIINFTLLHTAPGDPALILAGERADPEYIKVVREEFGLDKPLIEQLVIYLRNLLAGNLGYSYMYRKPVLAVMAERIPATLLLIITSLSVALVVGTLAGAFAARMYLTRIDTGLSMVSLVLYSMPVFWLAIVLVLVFSFTLKWFPITGMITVGVQMGELERFVDILWHLALPSFSLATYYFGQYFRISRSSVVEVMREDYVTTARAVGFQENKVFTKYALRNAILPVVTMAGLQIGYMFAGAVLTETVYTWPGLGRLILEAILSRDYPLILGSYLIISVVVALATLFTDLTYALIDPRVAYK